MTIKAIKERFQNFLQPSQKSFWAVQSNGWDLELQNIRRALGAFDLSVQNAYIQNDAVFAIVSRFVLQFQEPVLLVQDMFGETIPDHPIRALLARPNVDSSESDLYSSIATFWATGGIAYLHKLRNRHGALVGLRAYSSAQILPKYRGGVVSHYEANINNSPIQLPIEDIIAVPFPVKDDMGRGIPPFLPSLLQVMTDSEATRYLFSVLKNDAVPRTVITQSSEISLGNAQRDLIKRQFMDIFGGKGRGEPLVLPTGANIERVSLSLQELTLDALRKVPEARLCAALQVPPELVGLSVGLENSTYSNKAEARKLFVENTMSAFWRYCAEAIERGLRPEFGDEYELVFDLSKVLALQENQDAKQARIVTAFEKGIITRNEARSMMGLETLPDQDVFIQDIVKSAQQLPQVESLETSSFTLLEQKQNAHAQPGNKSFCGGDGCAGEGCANICPKNADFYTKEMVMEWKAWDDLADTFSETLQKSMKPVFASLEKEILRNIAKAQKDLNTDIELFDIEDFRDALAKATGSKLQEFLLFIARQAATAVNTSWDDIKDDFAKQLGNLFGVSIERITGVADTLREELRAFIQTIADKPIAEVTEQLQAHFGNVLGSPARVARIARTTATAATAGSQRATWEIAGFKVAWLTQRDGKVRPAHRAMDGVEVDVGEKFRYVDENGNIVEGNYPANMSTASGSVNCRCYLRPIRK
jgi:HK97 family phage portal protein